jgi:hypothetical protein
VQRLVTVGAQGYQIRVTIVPLPAAKLFVMDLKVLLRAAELASPTIAAENLFSK